VTEITPRTIQLLEDMKETLHKADGCGLAAPQVGVLRRIALVEVEPGKLYELINPEIIARETLEPVADGEVGELVFTTLTKEGIPLIRYRTKDLTSITHETCECGRTSARISRFKGRSDDMLIIRGVNVFPSQVEAALINVEEVTPHYMMVVDRENNLDTLEIQVEVDAKYYTDEIRGIEKLTKKISTVIQQALGISAKIKIMSPNSLKRSEGKAVHVIDNRKYD
jgi:phenylacetate-CoA ligase